MSLAPVFRVGLGVGSSVAIVAWYAVNVLFLKVVLRWPMIDAIERLAYVCLFVALAVLVPLGGLAAWQAGARNMSQSVWAGTAAGALAAIPAYALVASTVGALFGVVLPLLQAAGGGSGSGPAGHQTVSAAVAGAMWAAPLIAVGTGLTLTLLGAASGACYGWLARRS